ncbi:MAG: TonB-dependent receptor plug domain-containing protein [Longimicrobiales bacterium]
MNTRHAILPFGLLLGLLTGCGPPHDAARPSPSDTSNVTSEDIDRTPNRPIEEILAGRVAGVRVAWAPDGGIMIRIRGGSSILGSNDPLYVIDGIPIEPGPGGSLTGINPYDIESIEVLKDPSQTALYGLRGANGVVIIVTKRPGG